MCVYLGQERKENQSPRARKKLAVAISALLLGTTFCGSSFAQFNGGVFDLSDLNGSDGFRIDGESNNDKSGDAVSSAGDINGDGIEDLIIGAYTAGAGTSQTGRSYVVFGRSTASEGAFNATLSLSSLDGSNGFRLDGAVSSDRSGNAVSHAGDVNGDGIDDLVIGARQAGPNGFASGSTFVVFGRDTQTNGNFPAVVSLAGLDGSDGFRIDGVNSNDFSGASVSTAGDINGDGADDLIIGAPGADFNGSNSGSSYLVFGRQTQTSGNFPAVLPLADLNGSNGVRFNGESSLDESGSSVSAAGDFNGDGFDDLIIGAPYADSNGNNSGSSYIVFGGGFFAASVNLSDLNSLRGIEITGGSSDDFLGLSVRAAGDMNGDGLHDVVIGAPNAGELSPGPGRSYVVFGDDQLPVGNFSLTLDVNDLNGSNGFWLNGIQDGDRTGLSVSAAGDFNNDGVGDLIIGARGANQNGAGSGSSYLIYGRATATVGDFPAALSLQSLDGITGVRFDGSSNTSAGTSVSGAGDINGDELGDFIIGAPNASPNGASSGSSYVVFGRQDAVIESNPEQVNFGQLEIGTSSAPATITLRNTSDRSVTVNSLAIQGSDSASYSLEVDQCSGQPLGTVKGVNDECVFNVRALSTQVGAIVAVVVASYNSAQSPVTIPLESIGVFSDAIYEDRFEQEAESTVLSDTRH